jgi:protein-S-isoprenylcysteine O-methyltransferase Ste14
VVTVKREIVSVIPAFELGVWNAWIFVLPFFLAWLSGLIINKDKWVEAPLNEKEKSISRLSSVVMLILFIYPIFLPLRINTVWFYFGFLFYLVGMILVTAAEVNFATTPICKTCTKGGYRISRNPMFFGGFLLFIGIGLVCVSWIYLLLGILLIILMNVLVNAEERFCLEKYGDAYREFMNRTPKWIGIPKSERKA